MIHTRSLTLAGGLALLSMALVPAARAQSSDEGAFYKAYYLEHSQGDLEGALDLYKAVANDRDLPKSLRVQAKQRANACWEELASSDFARLVPEETILYVELNRPGDQLARLLDQLGLLTGSEGSGNVAISPLLVDGLLGLRGAAVAITHVDPTGGPPNGVAILHPGDMGVVRGLIETALPAGGIPVDGIGGFPTWRVQDQVLVTMTERLVLASPDRGEIEGVLARLAGKRKGSLAHNEDLAKTMAMRGDDLLFFCLNAEPILPMVENLLGGMAAQKPELAMAMTLLDVGSTRAVAGRLGVDDAGISLDLGLQLDEGHRNLVFNFFRKPHLAKRTLKLVPAGSAFFWATSLNEPAKLTQGTEDSQGRPIVTLMDLGREVFANVVDVTLYGLPSTTEIHGQPIPDIALALTVNDPERSRAIWEMLLGIAKGATGDGSMRPKQVEIAGHTVERYDIEGVGIYLLTHGNTMVVSPSEHAVKASLAAAQGKNVLQDELFHGTLSRLGEAPVAAMAVSPGRVARLAKAYVPPHEMREIAPYLGMLEDSVFSASVEHSDTTLALSMRLEGLPKVGVLVSEMVAARLHGARGHGGVNGSSFAVRELPAEPEYTEHKEKKGKIVAVERDPSLREAFDEMVKANQVEASRDLLNALTAFHSDEPLELNNLAWALLTEEHYGGHYHEEALKMAKTACEASEWGNWYYLDTLGVALFETGHLEKAVEVQSRAVEVADGAPGSEEVVANLKRFKRALKKKGAGVQ